MSINEGSLSKAQNSSQLVEVPICISGGFSGSSLILNGNFSSLFAGGTQANNWSWVGSEGKVVTFENNQAVFPGAAPGGLELWQNVATIVGKEYQVSFNIDGYYNFAIKDSSNLDDLTNDILTDSNVFTGVKTFTFTAISTSTKFLFRQAFFDSGSVLTGVSLLEKSDNYAGSLVKVYDSDNNEIDKKFYSNGSLIVEPDSWQEGSCEDIKVIEQLKTNNDNVTALLTNSTITKELVFVLTGATGGTIINNSNIITLSGYTGTQTKVSYLKAYATNTNTVENIFTLSTETMTPVNFVDGETYSVGNENSTAGGNYRELGNFSINLSQGAVVKFFINVF